MRSIARFAIPLLAALSSAAHAACDSPEYQQFDFWLGAWEVRTPDGKVAGQNRITREYGGCVIHERYTTPRDYSGESLNTYDPARGVWHQTWVDTEGALLLLEGRFANGKMTLEGQTTGQDKKVTKHRIEWTRNPDGSVRQFWQSTDATGAWITTFDGRYVRLRE